MKKGYVFISNSTKPAKGVSVNRNHKLDVVEISPLLSAKELGYDIYLGINDASPETMKCSNFDVMFYDQHCYRSIFALKDNYIAYKNLYSLLKNHPEIEVIHCNTPIGGAIGRILGKKFNIKKIIYTAHGFHFYKGAPLFYRTFLKWAEQIMAHWTDALITMNNEDYEAAKKFKLRKGGKVYKIHGVGVYTNQFNENEASRLSVRRALSIPDEAIVCIAMGDIIPRKNFATAIEAIALAKITQVHYIICGLGNQMDTLKQLSKKLGIESQIHFLGFRSDIKELAFASDFFLFSSLQEGLPRSTMEAMCVGLPCIVSNIRGNNDLIEDGKGGYLVTPTDKVGFAHAIQEFVRHPEVWKEMSDYNKRRIKSYDISVVKKEIMDVYKEILR